MSDQVPTTAKPIVPGGVAALIFAICSCIFGWYFGFPGIILAIIGMILAGKGNNALATNPNGYKLAKFAISAKTWSMVGLIQGITLSVIYTIIFIILIASESKY